MPEKILEVRMFEVRYTCDGASKPGCEGMMAPTGEMLTVNPPLFKHRCIKCGDVKFLPRNYPMTIGLPISEPIPDVWVDKLDRPNIHNPPPEKSKIIQ